MANLRFKTLDQDSIINTILVEALSPDFSGVNPESTTLIEALGGKSKLYRSVDEANRLKESASAIQEYVSKFIVPLERELYKNLRESKEYQACLNSNPMLKQANDDCAQFQI
jgi:hypothetical protein